MPPALAAAGAHRMWLLWLCLQWQDVAWNIARPLQLLSVLRFERPGVRRPSGVPQSPHPGGGAGAVGVERGPRRAGGSRPPCRGHERRLAQARTGRGPSQDQMALDRQIGAIRRAIDRLIDSYAEGLIE